MADYAYVAFLDILGYKNLLDNDINNGTQIFREKMIEAFRVFDGVNQSRYAYKAISDSIFITCSDRSLAGDLIELIRKVYVSFLEQGLLIRGGLSYGEHFQNQTITYSPALTKAYSLESGVADFPRIMVDQNVIDMFPELRGTKVLRSGIYWYINIVTEEDFKKIWRSAKNTKEASMSAIKASEKVRIKHKWLQDHLIEQTALIGFKSPEPYLKTFDEI